eukprot:TRINITY_DN165_c0_g2_i1.p1 TRINITY_DN165_c0_g2~~TRINITY_DN165_c0_g2_i1.p1  ORF type:complete len:166 (+),score=29.79 TRINITY_DN165_c0_g2_i1:52-549(+)
MVRSPSLLVATLLATAIAVLVPLVSCHLCLIYPMQRTPVGDLNKAGSPYCYFQTGPCGTTVGAKPTQEFVIGSNLTVVFQKNANHYNSTNPGRWQLNFQTGNEYFSIYDFPDDNSPDLSWYSLPLAIPSDWTPQAGVLQVVYQTNTVGSFYQCADVAITKDVPNF